MDQFYVELTHLSNNWSYVGQFAKVFMSKIKEGHDVDSLKEYLERRYSFEIITVVSVNFIDIEELCCNCELDPVSILYGRLLTIIDRTKKIRELKSVKKTKSVKKLKSVKKIKSVKY